MARALSLATGLAALLACAAAARGADSPGAVAGAACHQTRIVDVEMETEPDGLVAVPVQLDDRTVMLAVDTGAIHTVISSRIADELKLERDMSAQVYEMLGGVPIYQMAYSHSFRMGQLATGRVGFLVAPSTALHLDTDGLFGPDAMNNYDVEIDYAHNRFGLFSQDHCPGQVVYWTHEPYARIPMHVDDSWHISVPLTLDGRPLTAFVDTGAERSIVSLGTVKDLFGLTPSSPGMTRRDDVSVNGTTPITVYHYPFQTVNLEGIAVNHPDIDIMPDNAFGKDGPQMILGSGVLRQLHLYLAYKEQMLYATPAEAK
ncbi:MAG TPA: retroviral-like aspartic protease family protein [Rhizomicrobium sp.]|nr:retroviral-like aspartic protease family protein [Rhizomicrobium sp.]